MKKLLVSLLLSTLALTGCGATTTSPATEGTTLQTPAEVNSELVLEILKIGKADCNLITIGDATMMIDTGEDEDGEEIIHYLHEQGITQIDYLIITHFDKDHVGAADQIINEFAIGQVLQPNYTSTSKDYLEYVAALAQKNINPVVLSNDLSFSIEDAEVTVYAPHKTSYKESDNDFSLVTSLVHGENRLLFAGDAEAERLKELLKEGNLQSTFLKVPHHGNYNAQTKNFLTSVSPAYAVITCSKKNPASDEVLDVLNQLGTETFLTQNGDISCLSDGKTLTVTQAK